MKTEFELESLGTTPVNATIRIIGEAPESKPYVKIEIDLYGRPDLCIKDKDLERFAINILKALKSKHLKQTNNGK